VEFAVCSLQFAATQHSDVVLSWPVPADSLSCASSLALNLNPCWSAKSFVRLQPSNPQARSIIYIGCIVHSILHCLLANFRSHCSTPRAAISNPTSTKSTAQTEPGPTPRCRAPTSWGEFKKKFTIPRVNHLQVLTCKLQPYLSSPRLRARLALILPDLFRLVSSSSSSTSRIHQSWSKLSSTAKKLLTRSLSPS
jgi:hypothetical protein